MCLHVCLHVCFLPYTDMMAPHLTVLGTVLGILTTCTWLHTHYMYLSTYSLHVLVYTLTTCTCLHTHYLSTGVQSEVISTDPKIAPVNDQPSVYGELTHSGQMVQTYNC